MNYYYAHLLSVWSNTEEGEIVLRASARKYHVPYDIIPSRNYALKNNMRCVWRSLKSNDMLCRILMIQRLNEGKIKEK